MSLDPTPHTPQIETDPVTGETYQLYKKDGDWIRDYRKFDSKGNSIKTTDSPDIVYLSQDKKHILEEKWVDGLGETHRINGPARIVYDLKDPSKVLYIEWQKNGKRHRGGFLPNIIWFHSGSISDISFYYEGINIKSPPEFEDSFWELAKKFKEKIGRNDRESVLFFDKMLPKAIHWTRFSPLMEAAGLPKELIDSLGISF